CPPLPARRPLSEQLLQLRQTLTMEAMEHRAIMLVVPTIKAADIGAVRNTPDLTPHTAATPCRIMRRVTALLVNRVPWSSWTTVRCIVASRFVAGSAPLQHVDAGALGHSRSI